MDDENVQNLLTADIKFDLVIVEQFNNDCGLAIAHKFRAPIIGITSHMLLPWHYQRYGVPYNPSYVLFDLITAGTRPTFLQRIQRSITYNYINFVNKHITQRLEQNVISDYMEDVPPLEEIAKNIRLVLVYQNFVLSGSSALPANIIEVGGFHVSKPKPLPDDLKKFIEESEHGVIYVSFGSILKPSSMSKDKMIAIIETLKELKQRVIWKWNKKDLPGNPKNILVTKWLPQNDILAHPNVLAFFSHCGQLGVTEAVYHGVPVIGMPIFGDQPSNAAAVEESGLGVRIALSEITKERLLEKFKTVLNPSFRENVKLISKAWHDRPLTPMDTAIFWTEYAARHNITYGPPIVSTYQYYNLDIIALFILLTIVNMVVIKFEDDWIIFK
ncbi:UDP-glycosyltransferase UGT5-like [Aricia agestis]|uniref:UDP-glycosyltransferase UGT5-like n=1 Tax=Aricia agestis TaxID=91739 RepID=UPI001C2041B4|nr:UDP-glycosyltransferase UGT5-like [Aricia agestis]